MPVSRRKKLAVALLGVYWPVFFLLSHVPIPEKVRQAGLSDKALHVICYMILSFLLWAAIFPMVRVDWRKTAVWWLLLGIVGYGVVDELIQAKVGRTPDVRDFAADMVGTLISLVLLSVLGFWKVFLTITATAIFGLSNVARENPAEMFPATNALFHAGAYTILTGLWVRNMRDYPRLNPDGVGRLAIMAGGPLAVLVVVKVCSMALGKAVAAADILLAGGAIGVAASVFYLRSSRAASGPEAE